MTPEDPTIPDLGRLLAVLQGLDLTSADGRAGIGSLLSEIERLSPGAVLQQAARIELRALGWAPRCVVVPSSAPQPQAQKEGFLARGLQDAERWG